MIKKLLAIFIRWSIVKRYIQSAYRQIDPDMFRNMDADDVNYWTMYILTGKSNKELVSEYQSDDTDLDI